MLDLRSQVARLLDCGQPGCRLRSRPARPPLSRWSRRGYNSNAPRTPIKHTKRDETRKAALPSDMCLMYDAQRKIPKTEQLLGLRMGIVRPKQTWSSDITFIRLDHGFAYLVAVVDGHSRQLPSWRLSNTLDAGFCMDCLEDALITHGKAESSTLPRGTFHRGDVHGGLRDAAVAIRMDGSGRALGTILVERLWRIVNTTMCQSRATKAVDPHRGPSPSPSLR